MNVRPDIAAMTGYAPGLQPKAGQRVVKLNTNESPWPPSPKVAEAIAAVTGHELRTYPDPSATEFRRVAAKLHGVSPDHILAANGSDDVLTILTRTVVPAGGKIACPWPTYSLYPTLCEIQGATLERVPWKNDWSLPIDALVATEADAIYLANPNAPSGTLVPADDIADLAAQVLCTVLIDEAYVDFADSHCIDLVEHCDNVLVSRTLSKGYGLAGIRFGYGIGRPAMLIDHMHKVRDSYNCDVLAQAAAIAALQDQDYAREMWEFVRGERARVSEALAKLGFTLTDSHANFVFARHANASAVFEGLNQRGIIVRHWDTPELREFLRITVGPREANDEMLAAVADIVAGLG